MDDIIRSNGPNTSKRSEEKESGATAVEYSEPIDLFEKWFLAASNNETSDHTAMTLATVGANGVPSARMVLLKDVDESGFVFYTNTESRKGHELQANPAVALCFHWPTLKRSVRIEGIVKLVSDKEADAYFASRTREAQIGAWASDQSRTLHSRLELKKRVAQFALKFNVKKVPRPPHWTGYRVVPDKIEFWRNRPFRLHDRILYDRFDHGWHKRKLYP